MPARLLLFLCLFAALLGTAGRAVAVTPEVAAPGANVSPEETTETETVDPLERLVEIRRT